MVTDPGFVPKPRAQVDSAGGMNRASPHSNKALERHRLNRARMLTLCPVTQCTSSFLDDSGRLASVRCGLAGASRTYSVKRVDSDYFGDEQ